MTKKKPAKKKLEVYKVVIGFNFGANDERREIGMEVTPDELGQEVFKELLLLGAIQKVVE